MMLNSGRADAARAIARAPSASDLYDLRKSAGIVVLADCVRDANAAMDALMVYNDTRARLDQIRHAFRRRQQGRDLRIRARPLRRHGRRECCARLPEFRRLIDGAKAGLALIPKAIATRDSDLLHRILIELRSFDNLLAFRFG